MSKPIDTLLRKEMSRKEFLATLGFGLASVMGLSTIIKLLSGKSPGNHLGLTDHGYGANTYGGITKHI